MAVNNRVRAFLTESRCTDEFSLRSELVLLLPKQEDSLWRGPIWGLEGVLGEVSVRFRLQHISARLTDIAACFSAFTPKITPNEFK